MNKKILIATGSNGYILKNFDFNKYNLDYQIYYISSRDSKDKFNYSETSLQNIIKIISSNNHKSITLLSFGSHMGGADPGQYFQSIDNLKRLIKKLSELENHIYIYHASSFSIFNPNENSSVMKFLISESIDLRGPYSFTKMEQNDLLKSIAKKNKLIKVRLAHIGHVYDKNNTLANRFIGKSFKFYKIIISFLYSPFKLINPCSISIIHNDINNYIRNCENQSTSIDEKILTDKDSPISLFKVFFRDKLLFISPLPTVINTLSPIIIFLLPKYSHLSFFLKKYLQMNNSIKH